MNTFLTAAAAIPMKYHFKTLAARRPAYQFYFENETMAGVVPLYSQALGGIKLKVHPNDIDTVKNILKQLNPLK